MLKYFPRAPIGKLKGKKAWCVVSHKRGHKVLSCYPTKSSGEKALRRIEVFSHMKKTK